MEKIEVKEAKGKLGILVVGVGGAVSTTMITGTLAARKGVAKPIGSIAQMATMRLESGEEKAIKDIVPLADLNDMYSAVGIYSPIMHTKLPCMLKY